jgi:Protein of unknown function (DUF1194)
MAMVRYRDAIGRALCGALLLLVMVGSAAAQPAPSEDVDLQLVLAVDASGSVDQTRFDLQKQGYAAAFRNRQVLDAIRSGPTQAISVTMVQWTGPALQIQVVPWTRVGDAESAVALADAIAATSRRLFGGGTSISGAIDYAMTLWRTDPYRGTRRVIDVSGDGANNRGRPALLARDEAIHDGVGINGLPILALEPDLDEYYRDNVIGGPGAFVIAAQTYDVFAAAILRKLINEISFNGVTRGQAKAKPAGVRLLTPVSTQPPRPRSDRAGIPGKTPW